MKIIIKHKEETGITRYYSVGIEVEDGDDVYELETILTEMYDENSDSSDYEVGDFEWLTTSPQDSMKELLIEEEAERVILERESI